MIKQRIASLGLGLALLGSFAGTATAEESGIEKVTVLASTTDVLTVSVSPDQIDFGTMDFLGGNGVNIQEVCKDADGARYISPNIAVTVSSSKAYTVDRGVYNNDPNVPNTAMFELLNSTFVNDGTYQGGCVTGGTRVTELANTLFEDSGTAGKDIVAHEFFAIQIKAGEPAASYNLRLEYSAEQLP